MKKTSSIKRVAKEASIPHSGTSDEVTCHYIASFFSRPITGVPWLEFEQDRTMETPFGSGLFQLKSLCSDSELARAQLEFDAWKLLVQAGSSQL